MARCQLRRLRGIAASAPLPAVAVALVVALAPIVSFRLGGTLGAQVSSDGAGAAGVTDALVLGPLLAAAAAGAALAVAAPGRSALGNQIAAGPSGRTTAVVALVLVPAAAGSVVVVPSLLAVGVGLGRALTGDGVAGMALAVATIAAVPAGAMVAEGGLAAARGPWRRAVASVAGVLGWLGLGLVLGSPSLGPLALVSGALRGSGSQWLALAVSSGVAIGLTAAWVALAATRAEPRSRALRPARGFVGGRHLPIPLAAAVLLARRGDLRLATGGAIVFGLTGAALAAATEAPAPAPFLLGTTTALLGSLLCPLVVGGMLVDGRWLWRSGPVASCAIASAVGVVGLTAAGIPVVVVGALAAVASGAAWGILGVVLALVVAGAALALIAGALIPWRGAGAGDQMTTIAAFAASAIAASFVVGIAAPRLVSRGIPDPAVAVSLCALFVAAARTALDRRLRATG